MPASEFYECMLYEKLEPFGERRGDIQAGQVCAVVANVNRTKESDKVFNAMDFVPEWEPKVLRPQTPEDHMHIFQILQMFQNAGL